MSVPTARRVVLRFLNLFRRERVETDLAREVEAHLALLAEEFERRGMTPADAGVAARRAFGGVAQVKDRHRDARSFAWVEELWSDVRYACRTLRHSPGFTAVAVLTLAVGIGVNAIVFTVTNAVLFKGFPLVEGNDRIVYMTSGRGCCVSYPDFADWRAQAASFQGMALVHGVPKTFSDGGSFPERVDATEVTAATFSLVGQKPILGRDFTSADKAPGAPPVVILRYGLWERRFGKDPAIIGRTVRLNGVPTTVIGVMPSGFSFPQNQDFWVPLVPTPEVRRRDVRDTWFVFGRLRDGVTIEHARAELETIGRRLGAAYPHTNQGRNLVPHVEDFEGFFIGSSAATTYRAMWVAVGFVLLIACANLANLLLARAMARSREISVRMAIGAGRWRIIRQLLIESVTLAAIGGVVGWGIARWGVGIYVLAGNGSGISDQTLGTWFNDVLDYSMDYRVFAYLAAISMGTGVLFGLAPATRLSRLDVNASLKEGGRHAIGDARTRRLSGLLVAGEVALAIVLLAGAGVMVRSFLNVSRGEPTFRSDDLVTALLDLPSVRYPDADAQIHFYDRLSTRLKTAAGVESLAISSSLPGGNTATAARRPYEVAGAPTDEQSRPTVATLRISGSYFSTLGVPLVAGRDFRDADAASALPVAIVNQRFADRHGRAESALGKRVRLFRGTTPDVWLTVVGVAPDIVQNRDLQEVDPVVYVPYGQQPFGAMWVMIRAHVPFAGLATEFRRELQAIDPELPIVDGPAPIADRFARAYQYRAVMAALFLIFAAIALLLASVGLYAVLAHSVGERTQEIGVRTALGAGTHEILGLVLGDGMRAVACGLVSGLAAWFAVSGVLQAALVHVSPMDPVTLAMVCVVLIVSATIGCLLPARRALRVDPAIALRLE